MLRRQNKTKVTVIKFRPAHNEFGFYKQTLYCLELVRSCVDRRISNCPKKVRRTRTLHLNRAATLRETKPIVQSASHKSSLHHVRKERWRQWKTPSEKIEALYNFPKTETSSNHHLVSGQHAHLQCTWVRNGGHDIHRNLAGDPIPLVKLLDRHVFTTETGGELEHHIFTGLASMPREVH